MQNWRKKYMADFFTNEDKRKLEKIMFLRDQNLEYRIEATSDKCCSRKKISTGGGSLDKMPGELEKKF